MVFSCLYIWMGDGGILLVMQTLWGNMSPQLLQTCVHHFEEDLDSMAAGTLDAKAVSKLASMGTDGNYAQNCWRDLRRWLPKRKLPPLHRIICFCPCTTKSSAAFRSLYQWFFLISGSLPSFISFLLCLTNWSISKNHCRRFWKAVSGFEHFRSHS